MRAPLSWIRDFTPARGRRGRRSPRPSTTSASRSRASRSRAASSAVWSSRASSTCDRIPNADRARLADIDYGLGQITVVCGAPNIEPGMVVAYAPTGATLPGGITLEAKDIRGIVSEGMLCSPTELGLGEDHSGILALPDDTELGLDVREALDARRRGVRPLDHAEPTRRDVDRRHRARARRALPAPVRGSRRRSVDRGGAADRRRR